MKSLKDTLKRPLLRMLAAAGNRVSHLFERPATLSAAKRALIIQFGGMGDVFRVFPLIERLQADAPGIEVGLLTNQPESLLDLYLGPKRPRHVLFDLQWSYPRKLWTLAKIRRWKIDLILNPTRGDGMLECAAMGWLIGAAHRIGFDQDGAGFLNTHKVPFGPALPILDQNLRLLESLGLQKGAGRLSLRISEAARASAAGWYQRHVRPGRLKIAVHPWASSHSEFRAWPFSRFTELMRRLVEEQSAVVLILGSASEAAVDRLALGGLPDSVHNLAGTTSLDEAAAFIASSDLFIGNDSGLLHMALAARVATVAVFGATPPAQVLHSQARTVAVTAGVPCQPCYLHQPFFDYSCRHEFRCLQQLPVQVVFDAALRQLSARH